MDRLIERSCGVVLPFIQAPDLKEAQRLAQAQAKFLLVYLHCCDHPDAAPFVTDVLGSLEMTALFRDSVLLFGAHVHDKTGYELSLRLSCTTFPYAALCLKQDVIFDIQGAVDAADFVKEVRQTIDEWYPALAKEISIRHERESARLQREREEAELEEAMRIDRERLEKFAREEEEAKAQAKAREEAARQAAMAEEEERQAKLRQAAEEQRQRDEVELKKAVAMSSLPDEPPPSTDQSLVATIALRTFTGKTYTRKFFRTNVVQDVYTFASCTEAYDGRPFHLAAGFPPRRIDGPSADMSTRIGDVPSLVPSSVVVMREERSL